MSDQQKLKLEAGWKTALNDYFESPAFSSLKTFVREEYAKHTCYPPKAEIFSAFDSCPYQSVKVVIIGQDPYHGQSQANGLCFSVAPGVKLPPSLRNIFKELKNDLQIDPPANGDLTRWAKQGILLLNATLTVREGQPNSHQGKGWEELTDRAIQKLNSDKENLVFILWGAFAQKKASFIDEKRHMVLKSAHPSPFSADRGFFGNKHFSKTNDFLKSVEKQPIFW